MPGPGQKKHKSKKVRSTASSGAPRDLSDVDIPTVLDACVDEISHTEGWEVVVLVLCRLFELPEMNTRSGLKKIHANFSEIQRQLDASYQKYESNEKVVGGIIGIWGRMAVDSILRDKLVNAGMIERMSGALDVRTTRYVALEALSTVTHHGGKEVRQRISKHTPKLLRLLEEFPDNTEMTEQVISILDHAVSAVVGEETFSADDVRVLDIPSVLRLTLSNAIRSPTASRSTLTHALDLLCGCTPKCGREVRAVPAIISLLVACLRCEDLLIRAGCLLGLLSLNWKVNENPLQVDPMKLMAKIQTIPEHLRDTLVDYDVPRCDTFMTMQCTAQYQKAMMQVAQDHNLLSLGRTLGRLITSTEHSVGEGGFQSPNPRTGKMELIDVGLPFKLWFDAMPACAKVLRETGDIKDLETADVLDIKFLIAKRRIPEMVRVADEALARSPQVAYYYYGKSLSADKVQGLRACKKGLKCRDTTPFIRANLLWRAVAHAGELGLTTLHSAAPGSPAVEEGVAFIMSALEDSKVFVSETPPDNRHMVEMLNWYILLTIAFRGSDLSPDLRDLDDEFKKLKLAKEFMTFFELKSHNDQTELTTDLVMSRYKAACVEWSKFLTHLNSVHTPNPDVLERSAANAGDNLAAWLAGLRVEGEAEPVACGQSRINFSNVHLYRCSHCHNPSAVLRKCSGCGETRYCDSSCQKAHWSEHKRACKAAQALAA